MFAKITFFVNHLLYISLRIFGGTIKSKNVYVTFRSMKLILSSSTDSHFYTFLAVIEEAYEHVRRTRATLFLQLVLEPLLCAKL